eukprot:Nk52_evm21s1485 gene=Nk52_evmTU21s1485
MIPTTERRRDARDPKRKMNEQKMKSKRQCLLDAQSNSEHAKEEARTTQLLDLPNEMLAKIVGYLCEETLLSRDRRFANDLPFVDPSQLGLRNLLLTCRRLYGFRYNSNLNILKCTHFFGYLQELCNREMWKQVEKEFGQLQSRIRDEWEMVSFLIFALKQRHPVLFYSYLSVTKQHSNDYIDSYEEFLSQIDPSHPIPSPWTSSTRSTPLMGVEDIEEGEVSFFAALFKAMYKNQTEEELLWGSGGTLIFQISWLLQDALLKYIPSSAEEDGDPFLNRRVITKELVEVLRFVLYQLPGILCDVRTEQFVRSSKVFIELVLSRNEEVIYLFDEYFRNVVHSTEKFVYQSYNGFVYTSAFAYNIGAIKSKPGRFAALNGVRTIFLWDHLQIMRVLMACTAFASGQEEMSKKILRDEPLGVKSIGKEEAHIDEDGSLMIKFIVPKKITMQVPGSFRPVRRRVVVWCTPIQLSKEIITIPALRNERKRFKIPSMYRPLLISLNL